MRVVHDVESKMQVTGACHPYTRIRGKRLDSGPYGFVVNLTATCGDEEHIEIYGNALYIRYMLLEMVTIIEGFRQEMAKK